MTKADLEHENAILKKKIELLELKMERDQVFADKEMYILQKRIAELEAHQDKPQGAHAIGFYAHDPEVYE